MTSTRVGRFVATRFVATRFAPIGLSAIAACALGVIATVAPAGAAWAAPDRPTAAASSKDADAGADGGVMAGDLHVAQAGAPATAPGSRNGAVYLVVMNHGAETDRLLGASTPVAAKVELHTMTMTGDVMRMREIDSVDIAAGHTLTMKPGGGDHIMLIDLKNALKAGDRFPLELRFERAGKVEVEVVVGDAGGNAPSHGGHAHRH